VQKCKTKLFELGIRASIHGNSARETGARITSLGWYESRGSKHPRGEIAKNNIASTVNAPGRVAAAGAFLAIVHGLRASASIVRCSSKCSSPLKRLSIGLRCASMFGLTSALASWQCMAQSCAITPGTGNVPLCQSPGAACSEGGIHGTCSQLADECECVPRNNKPSCPGNPPNNACESYVCSTGGQWTVSSIHTGAQCQVSGQPGTCSARGTCVQSAAHSTQTLIPSLFPLDFTEVAAFSGADQHPYVPKGIAYNFAKRMPLVSLSGGTGQAIALVASDGSETVTPFGPMNLVNAGFPGESLIAVAPFSGPPISAGFTPGDVFVGTDGGVVARLDSSGRLVNARFAILPTDPNYSNARWPSLAFDTNGSRFRGQLLATTQTSALVSIDPHGAVKTIAANVGNGPEGLAIAPPSFGPYQGMAIAAIESNPSHFDPTSGNIVAIDSAGAVVVIGSTDFAGENIAFVPATGGTYFQAETDEDAPQGQGNRSNRLWEVSPGQMLARLGHLIAVNELGNEFWEMAWDASTQKYTQQFVGRLPGRFTSQGFFAQGTEAEQGAFAELSPSLATNWGSWTALPGATTRVAVAAAMDPAQNLQIALVRDSDGALLGNGMWGNNETWLGWNPVQNGIATRLTPALANFDGNLWAFVVTPTGRIFRQVPYNSTAVFEEVPGNGSTNFPVTATTCNGRLVVAAIGTDNEVYTNELLSGGMIWTASQTGHWNVIPGPSRVTDTPVGLGCFQDELYVFVHELSSGNTWAKVRTVNFQWSDWAVVPGVARTNLQANAASLNGQLNLFVVNPSGTTQAALASETGTWSASPFSLPITAPKTSVPVAAAVVSAQNGLPQRMFLVVVDESNSVKFIKAW